MNMRSSWMVSMCLAAVAAVADPETPATKVELFNGRDLSGWVKFAPGAESKVDEIWTVRDGVIRCAGVPNGYIRTEKAYRNYRLHVEWRWVEKPTNSGVLLHTSGPDRVWPRCVEAQLMHENAGDFWLLSQSTLKVGGEVKGPGAYVNVKKREPASEKPAGEWNAYDIACDGGQVRLVVNGVLQNEGAEANPGAGFICLQSEGSPIEFRNVYLEPLSP
jgi:hypothetical protein